jgi:ATP-binding cassette subfamily C protein
LNLLANKIYRESKYKILILILIVFAAALEFLGISMIFPFISLLFNIGNQDNTIITFLQTSLSHFGLPFSKTYLIIYLIVIIIFKSIILLVYKYFATKSVMIFMINLRERIYTGIFKSRFGFVSNQISRFINALTIQSAIAAGSLDLLYRILQASLALIGLILLGIIISYKMFLLALTLGFLVFLLLNITIKYSKILGEQLAKINESLYRNITQSLKNYRYLKSVEIYDTFYSELKPILSRLFHTQIRFVLINRGTQIITEPIVLTLILTVLFVGLNFFGESTSALFVIYIILGRFFVALLGIIRDLQSYSKDSVSARYCYDLIDETKMYEEESGDIKWNKLQNSIDIESLEFRHDNNQLFKDLTINIPQNKISVLYGKSGSGKTTLINIILGLLKPYNGYINIDGINIDKYDLKSYRKNIGFVSQDSVMFNLTVGDNLRLKKHDVSDQKLIKYIEDFELQSIFPDNKIDFDYEIDESTSNLSGGEKQRLALIRELVANPNLLILDEVTNALDNMTMLNIIKILENLKGKMTIIIVTHQPEYLSIADIAYTIKDGKDN